MNEQELREMLRSALRDLDVRPPIDAEMMCQRLAEQRGRPIVLDPRDDLPVSGGFGCLLIYPAKDVIVYQHNSTGPGRSWIIFHELTHLLRHTTHESAPGLMCGALTADHREIRRRGGTLYDAWQEWEAETGAAILAEWAGARPATSASLTASAASERAVARGFASSGSWT